MTHSEKTVQELQPQLPEGYEFVDKHGLQPAEIIALRESIGWYGDTPEVWQMCIEDPFGVMVGVRNKDAELVGMGRLTGDPRHGVLCDLAVKETERHQGIGRAILIERMRIARERNIKYIYTELETTNTLNNSDESLYEVLGLVATGNGRFRNALKP
jgi:ribosomal protein S18 acetylase RimI-like enzyme